MSEATTTLYVQLLGKFAMYYGGSKVQVGKNQTTKALQLLQLLLYMGSDGISRAQLLENLFGRDADGDVANNLRVTVYNLRKMLVASGLPDENYIRVEGGKYRFVSSFPVNIDSVVFEETLRAGCRSRSSPYRYKRFICRLFSPGIGRRRMGGSGRCTISAVVFFLHGRDL